MTVRVALVLLAAVLAPVGAARAVSSYVIQGDYKIGGYAVKVDGSLAGALAEFGPSTSRRRKYSLGEGCDVTWRSLGLRIEFLNLGGLNPCKAFITGQRWRTGRGLRVGHSVARLRRLYPKAQAHRDRFGVAWWLVVRSTPIGIADEYPGLFARAHNGRVTALGVQYAAGGD